jgi:hypothetical protein
VLAAQDRGCRDSSLQWVVQLSNDIVKRTVDDAVSFHGCPPENRRLMSNHRLQDLAIGLVARLDDGFESSQEVLDYGHVEPGEFSPRHVSIGAYGKLEKREIRCLVQGHAMLEQQWAQPCLRL